MYVYREQRLGWHPKKYQYLVVMSRGTETHCPINDGEMDLRIFARESYRWTMTSELKMVENEEGRVQMNCEEIAKAVT